MTLAILNVKIAAHDRTLDVLAPRAARGCLVSRATGHCSGHRPIVGDTDRRDARPMRTAEGGGHRRTTIRGETALDEIYLLSRTDAALAMAARATDANVKLIHFEMAGRYSVAAAKLHAGPKAAPVAAVSGSRP